MIQVEELAIMLWNHPYITLKVGFSRKYYVWYSSDDWDHPLLIKGQLISKCPYEKSVLSKIPTKIFPRFLP